MLPARYSCCGLVCAQKRVGSYPSVSRSWERLCVATCAGVSPKVCREELECMLVVLCFLQTVGVSPVVELHVVVHRVVS